MNLFGSERNYTKTLIRDLKEQNKRLKKELTDLTGKVYAGGTVLDEVTKRNVPLNLESPSASPGAVPTQTTVPQVSPSSIINPIGEIQLSRIAQAQQYRDMLDANRRFSEDDFRIREQFGKNELLRQLAGADRRQRIMTRGTMLQQGQLGAQSMGQQSRANVGTILAQTPVYQ